MTPGAEDRVADHTRLLNEMWRIRAFEEKVAELYAKGRLFGLLHLGIGQEASAVGVCADLNADDYVVGGHRSHTHALAKGAQVKPLLAEIAGKAAGYCGGKGGSMHIVAAEAGFITATGVVGGNIPLGVGAALGARMAGRGQVAAVFFGDGAVQTGAFHESLNLASLWKLPLVFVCENNGYAEFSALEDQTVVPHLAQHGETYGIASRTIDGNDVLAVRDAVAIAVERARSGGGPTFLEVMTYRLRGHYEGDQAKYREASESAEWKAKDPIQRLVRVIEQLPGADAAAIAAEAERAARAAVEEAAEWTSEAPWPTEEDLMTTVFPAR
ncbi:thiamine pyrophosphate-dependent dehydrogenase E1 component subunit alpha [Conexibacter woesei]|uniref:Pyruvate dehydrogenase (Acetyl-transferring) n=1 Tax=Conexibacter woesei (strain DSM 14684 / CCUG 47730 / CIP 108061 / JCM 11494 / NBRC 100937 / ID131577) TaxID=469383 RepID=D3F4P1_CONWI|nr:thiamine pyrophosphate-dependent dehydrogenase E1 component subunit alpha [Conexibacter woesei]ADB52498.1 Pyruvate dehydrogenase (acetyl-transferring) [Conexibacter woesei DSM 14684]